MAKPGIWPAVVACLFAGALLAPPSAIPHAGSEQAGSGVGQPAAPGGFPPCRFTRVRQPSSPNPARWCPSWWHPRRNRR